jgi:hypothetical protein
MDARWLKFGVPGTPGTSILCGQHLNSAQPWTPRPRFLESIHKILASGTPERALTESLPKTLRISGLTIFASSILLIASFALDKIVAPASEAHVERMIISSWELSPGKKKHCKVSLEKWIFEAQLKIVL